MSGPNSNKRRDGGCASRRPFREGTYDTGPRTHCCTCRRRSDSARDDRAEVRHDEYKVSEGPPKSLFGKGATGPHRTIYLDRFGLQKRTGYGVRNTFIHVGVFRGSTLNPCLLRSRPTEWSLTTRSLVWGTSGRVRLDEGFIPHGPLSPPDVSGDEGCTSRKPVIHPSSTRP